MIIPDPDEEDASDPEEPDSEFLLPPPPRESPDVYILGAGFSRALNPCMPLLNELSLAVSGYTNSYGGPILTSGLNSPIGSLIRRNFEEALSYLAEQKPWLEESENQKDKVLLLELTRNIRYAIGRRQMVAREGIEAGRCDWIIPLFEHWHKTRAVVITLNYDTLVEEIVERIGSAKYVGIPDPAQSGAYKADPRAFLRVCNIHPPILKDAWLGSSGASLANYFWNQPSFRLLKLHGSVNWFKSPDPNAHSDTISYVPGKDVPVDSGRAPPAWIADKAPFIIPPVPNKGSLVHHDSLRSIWRDAAEAIKRAKRIVVAGYSMPANDTLLMQLFRSNLAHKPPIDLVNPDGELLAKVEEMLKDQGSPVSHRFKGEDCVRKFVVESAFLLNHASPSG